MLYAFLVLLQLSAGIYQSAAAPVPRGDYAHAPVLCPENRAVFAFNYLVNVTGAIFALLLPDTEAQLTSELGMHYFNGHMLLVVLPILAVALGVFPRPKIKDVGYCIAVFTGYFLVVAVLNAWLVNYEPSVNYFS